MSASVQRNASATGDPFRLPKAVEAAHPRGVSVAAGGMTLRAWCVATAGGE
jgi:hypothetical protein